MFLMSGELGYHHRKASCLNIRYGKNFIGGEESHAPTKADIHLGSQIPRHSLITYNKKILSFFIKNNKKKLLVNIYYLF